MKKRVTVLALLCLLLTACGGKAEEDSGGQASLLGAASGLKETETLLTVDGREVPAWRYLYWLAYTCDRVEERYQTSGLALDWETPVSGGTLRDYARDQALADTALYATVENWAEQYGCVPAEEDAAAENVLPDMGLEGPQMEELERVGRLYAALYDLYRTDGSELWPAQEDLAAYGETRGVLTLDRILIAAGEDREAARERAAEAFSRLNGADDQATAFTALAAEGSDTAGPRTVLPEDGTLAPELLEAAQTLEEGQCSGILESEEGFSILRRLPLDTGILTEDYFDHLLQTAAENSQVTTTPAYGELDPASFFAALEETRQTNEAS